MNSEGNDFGDFYEREYDGDYNSNFLNDRDADYDVRISTIWDNLEKNGRPIVR